MVSFENIHTNNFIWIEQFVFMYLRITKEKACEFERWGHMEDLEGITGGGEMMQLYYNFKE